MKRNDLPHLRPLPGAVPPAHESAAPRPHAKAPEHVVSSAREEPSAAPSAAQAKPSLVAHVVPDEPAPAPVSKPAPSASVAAPSTAAPDAGWVKPAWAIPDDEPRRVHVDDARDAGTK